ncbi:aspartyl/asparaginyl beta-hydroxylase domain-containing protein [Tenacibaculum sp. 1_MG-2023]|uniref:aspartyl/asparaginyl beta-hydroxylase domain-containing protein n=1 Tax=Tenacibaculum sp. 1_MG-2023 TaxID=3062653 RepID=UPI0026E3EBFD|nr:aspartyl/asparaginyl beta-hydroxylase domain-containing protein [Tenacibaculum sp. 1_MG-2023]MDO6676793.1 aspartyl/asparaginyl beta-hydroxylase domain-containing protein [Tenacibaculum sp. 1_MG-2023]
METVTTRTSNAFSDRIKLPLNFNTAKMLEEAKALQLDNFEYYDVIPLRSPAHLVDTSLPFPPPAEDYADGSWTDWLDTNALKTSPYLTSIIDFFKENTTVNLVRLLRLAPHSIVKEHTDPTLALEIERSVIRLTIPILNNKNVTFYLNNTPVLMKPGECWYMRLTGPHKVINNGDEERINLTIDMTPNDWIRKIIKESQENSN